MSNASLQQPAAPAAAPSPARSRSTTVRETLAAELREYWNDLRGTKSYYRYREQDDRKRRVLGRTFVALHTVTAFVYLAWSLSVLNWSVWYVAVPFYLAEVLALLSTTLFCVLIWYPRFHRPDGPRVESDLSVDIFIATCGEPLGILRPTVEAAAAVDYSRKTVYILDDRASPEVERLALENGCRYLAREDRSDAKAGNLNFGLAHSQGDLILALDADQVPDRDIVRRMAGYFEFGKIALVQTPQRYHLPDGDPFGNADELFFRVIQNAKDSDNSAFSCGSGVMYRRAALEEVGGFSTWNLVEDLHTSLGLHDRGWRSVYHDHPLTTGTAPADIRSVYKQRSQWATDTMRMMLWDSPLKRAGLDPKQKLQYFYIGLSYVISGCVLPVYYLTPAWSLLTGQFMFTAPLGTYALVRGVSFALTLLALAFLWTPVYTAKPYKMWAGLFPVFFRSTLTALSSRDRKPRYHVTLKTVDRPGLLTNLAAVWPQLAVIAATLGSLAYATLSGSTRADLILINAFWGAWIVWTLSTICLAAVRPKRFSLTFEEYLRFVGNAGDPAGVPAPPARDSSVQAA
jgi:cellulose synthase (UDP-forming)